MVVEVPLTMMPRPLSDAAVNRQFQAPPSVGEERLQAVWRRVAQTAGMIHDGQSLLAEQGGVRITVGRQHRGSDGIFVVANLSCGPLHLDLRVQRATGLRIFGKGLSLEQGRWDRKYRVTGRDAEQVQALLCGSEDDERSLVHLLWPASSVEMDDEELNILWRDAGQSEASLRRIAEHAQEAAWQLDRARQRIPAPGVMREAAGAWSALAQKLHGPLETARMAIFGSLQGIPCEVITTWAPGGEPLHTKLILRPPLGISSSYRLALAVEGGELQEQEGTIAELPGEARELLPGVVEGAHSLQLTDQHISVYLDAPLMEPAPVHERLALMTRMLAAVQPNAGPYR